MDLLYLCREYEHIPFDQLFHDSTISEAATSSGAQKSGQKLKNKMQSLDLTTNHAKREKQVQNCNFKIFNFSKQE